MAKPIAGPETRVSALDRLLEVEARLEARLAAAREEGDARVAAAEAWMKEHFVALEAELEAARAASALRSSFEVGNRVRELTAARDAAVDRLDRVRSQHLESMVAWLAGEVVRIAGEDTR